MNPKDTKSKDKPPHSLESLHKDLKILNEHLEKKNSRSRIFVNAIIAGLGTAIGLTIVAGFLIAFLIDFLRSAETIPILKEIADIIESSL